MASRAANAMLVADSSKIDKRAFAAIGHRRLFSTIITDSGTTLEQRQRLTDGGYDVIVAE
jgi:DeoR family transcriptional regulator, aga operon transcriptional repressor